jgi:hypothetical protein
LKHRLDPQANLLSQIWITLPVQVNGLRAFALKSAECRLIMRFSKGPRMAPPPLRHNRRSGFAVACVPKVAKIQKMAFQPLTPRAP